MSKRAKIDHYYVPATNRQENVEVANDMETPPCSPHEEQNVELVNENEVVGSTDRTKKYTFQPFNNPQNPDWLRSWEQDSQRRRWAKCKSCSWVRLGTKKNLQGHKMSCTAMPEAIKSQLSKDPPAKPHSKPNISIPVINERNRTHPEKMDYLLAMFIVTSDIPFR